MQEILQLINAPKLDVPTTFTCSRPTYTEKKSLPKNWTSKKQRILESIESDNICIVSGVSGSGKTSLALQGAINILKNSRNGVLLLVPYQTQTLAIKETLQSQLKGIKAEIMNSENAVIVKRRCLNLRCLITEIEISISALLQSIEQTPSTKAKEEAAGVNKKLEEFKFSFRPVTPEPSEITDALFEAFWEKSKICKSMAKCDYQPSLLAEYNLLGCLYNECRCLLKTIHEYLKTQDDAHLGEHKAFIRFVGVPALDVLVSIITTAKNLTDDEFVIAWYATQPLLILSADYLDSVTPSKHQLTGLFDQHTIITDDCEFIRSTHVERIMELYWKRKNLSDQTVLIGPSFFVNVSGNILPEENDFVYMDTIAIRYHKLRKTFTIGPHLLKSLQKTHKEFECIESSINVELYDYSPKISMITTALTQELHFSKQCDFVAAMVPKIVQSITSGVPNPSIFIVVFSSIRAELLSLHFSTINPSVRVGPPEGFIGEHADFVIVILDCCGSSACLKCPWTHPATSLKWKLILSRAISEIWIVGQIPEFSDRHPHTTFPFESFFRSIPPESVFFIDCTPLLGVFDAIKDDEPQDRPIEKFRRASQFFDTHLSLTNAGSQLGQLEVASALVLFNSLISVASNNLPLDHFLISKNCTTEIATKTQTIWPKIDLSIRQPKLPYVPPQSTLQIIATAHARHSAQSLEAYLSDPTYTTAAWFRCLVIVRNIRSKSVIWALNETIGTHQNYSINFKTLKDSDIDHFETLRNALLLGTDNFNRPNDVPSHPDDNKKLTSDWRSRTFDWFHQKKKLGSKEVFVLLIQSDECLRRLDCLASLFALKPIPFDRGLLLDCFGDSAINWQLPSSKLVSSPAPEVKLLATDLTLLRSALIIFSATTSVTIKDFNLSAVLRLKELLIELGFKHLINSTTLGTSVAAETTRLVKAWFAPLNAVPSATFGKQISKPLTLKNMVPVDKKTKGRHYYSTSDSYESTTSSDDRHLTRRHRSSAKKTGKGFHEQRLRKSDAMSSKPTTKKVSSKKYCYVSSLSSGTSTPTSFSDQSDCSSSTVTRTRRKHSIYSRHLTNSGKYSRPSRSRFNEALYTCRSKRSVSASSYVDDQTSESSGTRNYHRRHRACSPHRSSRLGQHRSSRLGPHRSSRLSPHRRSRFSPRRSSRFSPHRSYRRSPNRSSGHSRRHSPRRTTRRNLSRSPSQPQTLHDTQQIRPSSGSLTNVSSNSIKISQKEEWLQAKQEKQIHSSEVTIKSGSTPNYPTGIANVGTPRASAPSRPMLHTSGGILARNRPSTVASNRLVTATSLAADTGGSLSAQCGSPVRIITLADASAKRESSGRWPRNPPDSNRSTSSQQIAFAARSANVTFAQRILPAQSSDTFAARSANTSLAQRSQPAHSNDTYKSANASLAQRSQPARSNETHRSANAPLAQRTQPARSNETHRSANGPLAQRTQPAQSADHRAPHAASTPSLANKKDLLMPAWMKAAQQGVVLEQDAIAAGEKAELERQRKLDLTKDDGLVDLQKIRDRNRNVAFRCKVTYKPKTYAGRRRQ